MNLTVHIFIINASIVHEHSQYFSLGGASLLKFFGDRVKKGFLDILHIFWQPLFSSKIS